MLDVAYIIYIVRLTEQDVLLCTRNGLLPGAHLAAPHGSGIGTKFAMAKL